MTNLYASDYPWCLEPLFMRSLNQRGRRPNLLVNCATSEVYQVASELMRWCAPPVLMCGMPGWLDLPSEPGGTLLLTKIEEMTLDQQIALFDWTTKTHPNVQVVSVATTRLDKLVKDGRFLEGLFYRLNVVQVDARTPAPARAFTPTHPSFRYDAAAVVR